MGRQDSQLRDQRSEHNPDNYRDEQKEAQQRRDHVAGQGYHDGQKVILFKLDISLVLVQFDLVQDLLQSVKHQACSLPAAGEGSRAI
jgi:hypothetical protein